MSVFDYVGGLAPARSVFPLNHTIKGDIDMGKLYPVLVEDCVPGDIFDIQQELVIRFHQSLFAPLLHEVSAKIFTFFTPYRVLWQHGALWPGREEESKLAFAGDWEKMISGGMDGKTVLSFPYESMASYGAYSAAAAASGGVGSLADWLYGVPSVVLTGSEAPWMFPRIAYWRIINEYFRDNNLTPEYDLDSDVARAMTPCKGNWEKDYLTSAAPSRQRGTSPAIPITGVTTAEFNITADYAMGKLVVQNTEDVLTNQAYVVKGYIQNGERGVPLLMNNASPSTGEAQLRPVVTPALGNFLSDRNTVDLGDTGAGFDASQMRDMLQTQKWLERQMRGGARYTETLQSHYRVSPLDERLDRPEFVGGISQPIVFSEVLQTSEAGTTPQGHLAGHGVSAGRNRLPRYRVKEHGLLMSLLIVVPRTEYQQGFDRMHLKDTKYDLVWPEFAHLSEQPVYLEEVYATASSTGRNRTIFGYQGKYNEYRYRKSRVCGVLRSDAPGSLDFWHLARWFTSEPGLNTDFIQCNARTDIFPVTTSPGMLCQVGNNINVARPLPISPDPGLLDHF